MDITKGILKQFKDRMHLGDYEDENLKRILSASLQELTRVCGAYDIERDEPFKELVFERSRYVYNDALEYFETNFLSRINSLSMEKALESITVDGDADAAI
ncbi:hypothetical protein [Bacillus sp. 1P06AnD]|uniref:hypothetical protein n=1 Tax=Bacillus sp. 1P06AnD TaxID=3132208 RepID=UPI0039A15F5E